MRGNDLTIYSRYAKEWWEAGSPRFRSLQQITPFRLQLIRELCGSMNNREVVDLGCGGGLISVPLLGENASVIGVDLSVPSIQAAMIAANGRGRFIHADITAVPLPDNSADLVLLADVLDHIPAYPKALSEAARIARPGGAVFVSTLNRTLKSWVFAILLGEGLRLVPPGTHAHELFISPLELQHAAAAVGLTLESAQGEAPKIWATVRNWAVTFGKSASCDVAYVMLFRKTIQTLAKSQAPKA